MGLHTGEPQVGEEGYIGLDVVRAARISAAGHGGQILISETTRALLGNQVPGGRRRARPRRTAPEGHPARAHLRDLRRRSRRRHEAAEDEAPPDDDLGARLEQRINAYVENRLERTLGGADDAATLTSLGAGGLKLAAGGIGVLVLLAVAVVAIILLFKLAL